MINYDLTNRSSFLDWVNPSIRILLALVYNVIILNIAHYELVLASSLIFSVVFIYLHSSSNLFSKIFSMKFYFAWLFIFRFIQHTMEASIVFVLKFYCIYLVTYIIFGSMSQGQMVRGVEKILFPLKLFGINTSAISLSIVLSISYIGRLKIIYNEILEAQKAKGGNIKWKLVLVPLLIRVINFAEESADSIQSRM